MSSKKRLLAVAMAAALLLSPITAAGAVASTAANDPVANDSLVVAVEQAGNDGATVTVSHNESAVENASVTVEVDGNGTYAGMGNYTTDESGTVDLPEPNGTVTVAVTAANGNLTGGTTAELIAGVEEDEGKKRGTFGQMVSSFVQEMLNGGEDDGALGQLVSEYVTSNNPGSDKKPDHAGKPDDAGKSDGAGKSGDVGQQDATDGNESQGPPENAGPSDDDEEDGEKGNSGDGKKNGHGKEKNNGKDR